MQLIQSFLSAAKGQGEIISHIPASYILKSATCSSASFGSADGAQGPGWEGALSCSQPLFLCRWINTYSKEVSLM